VTTTQDRLNAYYAAEAEILKAHEVRHGDKLYRMAELEQVRAQIDKLEAQLAREQARAAGQRTRFSLANLNRSGPLDAFSPDNFDRNS
jgi:hypothetical protein